MSSLAQGSQASAKSRSEVDKNLDRGFIWITKLFAIAIAVILVWISIQVALQAMPAIQQFGVGFLFETDWNPVVNEYGVLPQVYGTLFSSLIGLLISVPLGVGAAILLSEDFLPGKVKIVLVFMVELLAAIPSVVYGVWGLFVLVPLLTNVGKGLNATLGFIPFFSTTPTGPNMLVAGIILAIMTLPIITAISRDALNSVPPSLRQASLGLGATRWETILQVLVPAAFSGIVSAVMLALGRAMGETMAVTMLIGNSNNISPSLFSPANTISSLLANQFAEASGLQVGALMYAALVLFFLTFIVNVLAELIVMRVKRI
ncbi:Phosphate ABC transporter, permease protein PstC [Rivularia sp. IAM M-261]|nr:Phosphate ABC transporter, permease protein PstC [Calothrix sp. PCC 7716]GJD17094.1 Phosphate ABC transporter, permease protein PstC [Rivularia sp. IAM M-261]